MLSLLLVLALTPAQIQEAIALGQRAKDVKPYSIGGGMGPTWGSFTTPYLRIAMASSDAKRTYRPFAETDVTPDMVAEELRVYVWAFGALGGRGVISPQAVVIVSPGGEVIHPLRTEATDTEFQNAYGASATGTSLTAIFPLRAMVSGSEVRMVFDGGAKEQRWRFKLDKIR